MPRSGKKGGGRNTHGHRASDVTLDDFANCRVSAGRLRKSTSNSFVRDAKKCSSYEETIRNQEGEGVDVDEEEERGAPSSTNQNKTKLKGKCADEYNDQLHFVGQDYPLDLWFLLSEYISPEDVHIFASLCKSSLYVVRTYKFWITLYRRYYTLSTVLPENLLPQNIQRPRFLRLSVIRALHYMYPPFAKRISATHSVDQQAYHLRQLCCVALWYACTDSKFTFFLKFCASARSSLVSSSWSPRSRKPATISRNCCNPSGNKIQEEPSWLADVVESWEGLSLENRAVDDSLWISDVNANPEEGCCILKLACQHYVCFPPSVLGKWLADIKVTLTTDMRSYRVQLLFGSQSYHCSPKRRSNRDTGSRGALDIIEFSPVENVNVFHWWHPQYPVS